MREPRTKGSGDEADGRLRLLVESLLDYGIFILSPEGVVATWNSGAERLKGYRASEIIGKHFSTFYPPEDIAAGKCEMELDPRNARTSVGIERLGVNAMR